MLEFGAKPSYATYAYEWHGRVICPKTGGNCLGNLHDGFLAGKQGLENLC